MPVLKRIVRIMRWASVQLFRLAAECCHAESLLQIRVAVHTRPQLACPSGEQASGFTNRSNTGHSESAGVACLSPRIRRAGESCCPGMLSIFSLSRKDAE